MTTRRRTIAVAVLAAAAGGGLTACSTGDSSRAAGPRDVPRASATVTTPTPAAPGSTAGGAAGGAAGTGSSTPVVRWEDTLDRRTDPRGRRTDPQPLTKRFVLGTPEEVVWYSGGIGDDRVPGPSTYWVDAVVRLAPGQAERLRAAAGTLEPVEVTVVDELRPDLPAGPFRRSAALDAAVGTQRYPVRCALAADGRTLVLRSTFE